jgi:DnaJ-class molecular chaperone
MTHYETLGVKPDASADEIKVAIRKAQKDAHPDREGGSIERMQAINAARECLLDPEKRKRYDEYGDDQVDIAGAAMECVTQMIQSMLEAGFDGKDWVAAMRAAAGNGVEQSKREVERTTRELEKYRKLAGALESELFQKIHATGLQNKCDALNHAKILEAVSRRALDMIQEMKPGKDFMEQWEAMHRPSFEADILDRLRRSGEEHAMKLMLGWRS